ncbi:MAG: cytochrome c [Cyclobacteriaceae bacterium]|jgi:cytochrome c
MRQTLIFWLPLVLIFLSSCASEKKERPAEMWVFRSVMDEKPRMLTAALDDEMWLSYDIQTATLFKSWKGEVVFDGAVYTTVHGPQPTSEGYAYFDQVDEKWVAKVDGEVVSVTIDYLGHSTVNNELVIRYRVTGPSGQSVDIEENPEYIKRGNQNGLRRVFKLSNAGTIQVGLTTSLTSMLDEADFSTTGQFQISDDRKIEYKDGSTLQKDGTLWMNNEGETTLKVFYHPGFDRLGIPAIGGESEGEELNAGAALIAQSDCESCHNEKVKTVGPSYLQIANKYNNDEQTVEMLIGKIQNGGAGVWGETMMTAHPDLMIGDAKAMVDYILSLADGQEGGAYARYTLGVKSAPIRLGENTTSTDGAGFAVHAYKIFDQEIPFRDIISTLKPVKNGSVKKIHVLNRSDFDVFDDDFGMVFSGNLKIDRDDSYSFRLISDDGSYLTIDGKEVIDHGGFHGPSAKDGEVWLTAGSHDIEIVFFQGRGGAAISLQWFNKELGSHELLDEKYISHSISDFMETQPYVAAAQLAKAIPGDKMWLDGVHPSFDVYQARPDDFQPRVGGIDFLDDGRMVVCTWDSLGPVYLVDKWQTGNPSQMTVKRIASGLAEPLGIKVVDNEIYVLQKQELTRLKDTDGDDYIDTYETVSDNWKVSANFHEFAFGLVYKDGYFYGALATAIMPGGASANPQIPDRGKVVKINRETGETELIAQGLRTPNGIGEGVNGELFIADNQGDWLPASKIVHVSEDAFYGQRSVDPQGVKDLPVKLPVVWLPQDEIGNSPSTPLALNVGPYQQQMIHGEVTHGGVKRVFVEKVNGEYQGAVFRFTQGIEAGVNRIQWAPDGSLMIGGIGVSGNWGQTGKLKYGLQRLTYNETSTFEMLSVSARSDGFEIEFTEPIAEGQYVSAKDFDVQQWYYQPTADYGGPKLDLETLKVSKFSLSSDGKRAFFSLQGLKENHLVYFRIVKPFVSASNKELWTTEAWYTLNQLPVENQVVHADYAVVHNQLSPKEVTDGWKLLFNGNSTEGIRNFKKETLGRKWKAQNGTLHFVGKGEGDGWQAKDGGDVVITDSPYENYEFYLEWKISVGGNSGIIFNSVESEDFDYPWQTGPEMQVLDNPRHPDGQIFMHRAGDLYDMIPTKFVTVNEPMEWNRVRIVMKDGLLQQWQNGYKVVETQMWGDEWKALIAKSKFAEMEGFGMSKSGHIVLQDHGDPVWFRNIKIRKL